MANVNFQPQTLSIRTLKPPLKPQEHTWPHTSSIDVPPISKSIAQSDEHESENSDPAPTTLPSCRKTPEAEIVDDSAYYGDDDTYNGFGSVWLAQRRKWLQCSNRLPRTDKVAYSGDFTETMRSWTGNSNLYSRKPWVKPPGKGGGRGWSHWYSYYGRYLSSAEDDEVCDDEIEGGRQHDEGYDGGQEYSDDDSGHGWSDDDDY
ncbi:hypothetical protein BDV25DRAFT_141052 [Aspergillus avenaceus]|uniref:Uncharacterized protein n=1 Tax=Aspergillus avenaceus TaxID=36643 RepID=A0A5N6TSW7_ASPAV|nr:hypothetical protein BDV25DRAFT_141052 [Aspergillus avenaceus]